jgi:hypothetical protein
MHTSWRHLQILRPGSDIPTHSTASRRAYLRPGSIRAPCAFFELLRRQSEKGLQGDLKRRYRYRARLAITRSSGQVGNDRGPGISPPGWLMRPQITAPPGPDGGGLQRSSSRKGNRGAARNEKRGRGPAEEAGRRVRRDVHLPVHGRHGDEQDGRGRAGAARDRIGPHGDGLLGRSRLRGALQSRGQHRGIPSGKDAEERVRRLPGDTVRGRHPRGLHRALRRRA